MTAKLALFALAATLIAGSADAAAGAAHATTITASIVFAAPSALHDENGYASPVVAIPGFGNDGSPTATVGPGLEFGLGEMLPLYDGSSGFTINGVSGYTDIDSANFDVSSLNVTSDVGEYGALAWVQAFTADTPGYFSDLHLVDNTYDGLTYSATEQTLTLDWAGDLASGTNSIYSADFSFAGGVPEPASWALMILGFGLTGGALRRKAQAAPATA